METAVLSEVFKTLVHRGEHPQLYFWRTSSGTEVDIVIEFEGKLVPVEVKLSETPNTNMAKGIASFQNDLRDRTMPGYVVHGGTSRLPLAPEVGALPFDAL
jgi:predicted AAA+ superfamily ATPase